MINCKKQNISKQIPPYIELADDEHWKTQAIHEIISIIQGYGIIINEKDFDEIHDFDAKELKIILNDLCCN